MESAAFISPRGQVASWYPFRAYLEKHLSYGIDESSRKEQTNRTLNIRNEKGKKTTSHHQLLFIFERRCDAWMSQLIAVQATPAPHWGYVRLMRILNMPRLLKSVIWLRAHSKWAVYVTKRSMVVSRSMQSQMVMLNES